MTVKIRKKLLIRLKILSHQLCMWLKWNSSKWIKLGSHLKQHIISLLCQHSQQRTVSIHTLTQLSLPTFGMSWFQSMSVFMVICA